MSTIIQIKTFMCPNGIGNPNASCRWHCSITDLPEDKQCPNCKLDLIKTTLPEDKITITIRPEEDFDDPDLIEHGGGFRLRSRADEFDRNLLARDPLARITPRKEISKAERNRLKAKIRADIMKFRALEDL